jgi:TalC/MipB family fructose-6-phosphate aldolase
MEILLDSANKVEISRCLELFPIAGVTGNPTILKAEGKIAFFPHMRDIRRIIGTERSLHIQVVAGDAGGITAEAEKIRHEVDGEVFIKIPVTEEGLRAMGVLKTRAVHITATAVYTQIQGFFAAGRGADYIAVYYNRMENLGLDPAAVISSVRRIIDRDRLPSKILAASFKNMRQVGGALDAGAHGVTVQPGLLHEAFSFPVIKKAVEDFRADWISSQGDVSLTSL